MKVTEQRLKRIIVEEKFRAIVENNIPYTKKEFSRLIESLDLSIDAEEREEGEPGMEDREWWTLLDKDSIAYGMMQKAAAQYDAAQEKARKPLAMTKDQYLKDILYSFRTAGHKMSPTDTVRRGDHPKRFSHRSVESVVTKGYPKEGLPSRKITPDAELNRLLSPADKSDPESRDFGHEIETYVSPFGYIHAKVPDYDRKYGTGLGQDLWVYAGNWFPHVDKGQPLRFKKPPINKENQPWSMDAQKSHSHGSHGWPEVTEDTLKLEKEVPSPDRDALWGKGEFAKGTVDVQDPTMQEQVVEGVLRELRRMGLK